MTRSGYWLGWNASPPHLLSLPLCVQAEVDRLYYCTIGFGHRAVSKEALPKILVLFRR